MAEVRLVDLEIIKRYSLAVRREAVPAEELLAALDASRATVQAAIKPAKPRRTRAKQQPAPTEVAAAPEDGDVVDEYAGQNGFVGDTGGTGDPADTDHIDHAEHDVLDDDEDGIPGVSDELVDHMADFEDEQVAS